MRFTTTKTEMTMETKKNQKCFMDYAIWIDFPINAAFLTFCFIKIKSAFQMGINVAFETDFGIATGSNVLDTLLIFGIPILGFITLLSFSMEAIYLSLKMCKKQPFITEKYSIAFMIGKIICVIILIASAFVVKNIIFD